MPYVARLVLVSGQRTNRRVKGVRIPELGSRALGVSITVSSPVQPASQLICIEEILSREPAQPVTVPGISHIADGPRDRWMHWVIMMERCCGYIQRGAERDGEYVRVSIRKQILEMTQL